MKYWAIIPAAGISARLQADRPKQYLSLNNKLILEHVIDLFLSIPEIEKVAVVLHAKDYWWPKVPVTHSEKILTVVGGEKRVHSVLLGLDFLKDYAKADDWILVHDAARPCLQREDIIRLMTELQDHPIGGLLGLPIVDTLKKVNQQDEVIETVSRDSLWQAQTPQMFRYNMLKQAIESALYKKLVITDESSAVETMGHKPKMVIGSVCNIKITFKEDLKLALSIVRDSELNEMD